MESGGAAAHALMYARTRMRACRARVARTLRAARATRSNTIYGMLHDSSCLDAPSLSMPVCSRARAPSRSTQRGLKNTVIKCAKKCQKVLMFEIHRLPLPPNNIKQHVMVRITAINPITLQRDVISPSCDRRTASRIVAASNRIANGYVEYALMDEDGQLQF